MPWFWFVVILCVMSEFPCIACNKEVRPRQHGVSCDICGRWQHRTCKTGITLTAYREAVKLGLVLRYVCDPCIARIPVLEHSASVEATYIEGEDLEPPVLERSVPAAFVAEAASVMVHEDESSSVSAVDMEDFVAEAASVMVHEDEPSRLERSVSAVDMEDFVAEAMVHEDEPSRLERRVSAEDMEDLLMDAEEYGHDRRDMLDEDSMVR